jgi:hypothetical protein
VRWDEVFGDLEREWEALGEGERRAEIAERTRAEFARVTLLDRLRGSLGGRVDVHTLCGHDLSGELTRVGADFVLLDAPPHEWVVPVHALLSVHGLGPRSVDSELAGPVAARLGLASMLRRVAADRSLVAITCADGRTVAGRLQRVGADFVEMTAAQPDGPGGGLGRAPGAGALLAFAAITMARRDALDG